jgi:recombination protein RecA
MALQARLMSQALRKLTAVVSKSRTTLIFINQLRQKIGIVFGNPETTTGGNALKFYSSVRLDVRRISAIKDGEETVGGRVKIKVVKNKVSPPFKQVELDVLHNCGISREGSLIDQATNDGILQKSGTWFAFNGERVGQGRENVRRSLIENPDLYKTIEAKIREKHGLPAEEPPRDQPKAARPSAKPGGAKDAAKAAAEGEGVA